jgi:hypothetical protein
LAAVSAGVLVAAVLRAWTIADPAVAPPPAGPEAVAAAFRIHQIGQPIRVDVGVGSPRALYNATAARRRQLAAAAAAQILPAVEEHPEQVVVISLRDVPLSFSLLPAPERTRLAGQSGHQAARRYESMVAVLLSAIVDAVERKHPGAVLSVLGLPIEPEQAGVSLEIARQSNDRYGAVIDALGPFVPARRLVVFRSTLDEKLLASMGMREALRLREGRPIVFRTNNVWQALVDGDGPGYEGYLVAHASGRIERQGGRARPGSPATEVQVLLGDDPTW